MGFDSIDHAHSCSACNVNPCQLRRGLHLTQPGADDLQPRLSRLRRGDCVDRWNADGESYWTVTEGAMMFLVLLPDGRRHIAFFRFPGELLCPQLDGGFVDYMLQAVCDTKLCRVDGLSVSQASLNGAQADHILDTACTRIARAGLHSLVLGRLTAPERIATFLSDVILRSRLQMEDGVEFLLPMNREDIADYLGLNSETVSRIFTRLRKVGVLALPRPGRAVLRDARALLEMIPFEAVEQTLMPAPRNYAAAKASNGEHRDGDGVDRPGRHRTHS